MVNDGVEFHGRRRRQYPAPVSEMGYGFLISPAMPIYCRAVRVAAALFRGKRHSDVIVILQGMR